VFVRPVPHAGTIISTRMIVRLTSRGPSHDPVPAYDNRSFLRISRSIPRNDVCLRNVPNNREAGDRHTRIMDHRGICSKLHVNVPVWHSGLMMAASAAGQLACPRLRAVAIFTDLPIRTQKSGIPRWYGGANQGQGVPGGQRSSGLRTNVLIAVGASAFSDLGFRLLGEDGATQIISYIVSGIGFLGAGVILKDGTNKGDFLRRCHCRGDAPDR
jgi:MgtC family